jgi:uncharacterized membrane protein
MSKVKTAWIALVVLLILAGTGILLFTNLQYAALQPFMNGFAKDGQLESFTPAVHERLISIQWSGWVLIIIALGLIAARKLTQNWLGQLLAWMDRQGHAFRADARSLWESVYHTIKSERGHLLLLGVVFVAVTLNSARFLSRTLIYDESYTFNIFASRPLLRIISDYSLPNNHIFHSLLVHFSYRIFGSQPWAVRLPAFVAGILLVPAGYLAARMFFDRQAAILSAGLIGFFPILINYSTNARGYSLLNLISILLLTLAAYVRKQDNRLAWALMIILAAVGFYVVPTMLFPFGAIGLWLIIGWLLGATQPPFQKNFIWRLMALGVITALLVILLYVPVTLGSGLDSLLKNPFVAPFSPEDYWEVLQQRLIQTWDEFNKGVDPIITWLLILAFIAGLVFAQHKKHKSPAYPLLLVGFCVALVVLRRSAPFDRMWLFLMPVFLIWAAGGLSGFYQLIERKLSFSPRISLAFISLLLLLICVPLVMGGANEFQRVAEYNGYAEAVADFLRDYLTFDDHVAVDFPLDAPIIYYVRLYGLDDGDLFEVQPDNPDILYLLVDEHAGEAPMELLARKNIPVEALEMSTLTMLGEIHPVSIYRVEYRR